MPRAPRAILFFEPDEHPITGQLFGADPNVMASAAAMVEQLGCDFVDINLDDARRKKVVQVRRFGPVARSESALASPARGARCGQYRPAHHHKNPRRDWMKPPSSPWIVARMAEQIGIEGIAVHPRTRLQDKHRERRLEHHPRRQAGSIHSGNRNGDINSPEDAMRMLLVKQAVTPS